MREQPQAMSAQMHVLPNGLTVAVDPLPAAESVALGVYAMVGSRSEPEHLNGLAHVVEHMVFKGAGSRDTRQIAEAIEDVGGVINAWTARDQTVFYGRDARQGRVAAHGADRRLPSRAASRGGASRAREGSDPVRARRSHGLARRPRPRPSVRGRVRRPAARPVDPRLRGHRLAASPPTIAATGCATK